MGSLFLRLLFPSWLKPMVADAAKTHRPDSVATWIIALAEFTAIRPKIGLLEMSASKPPNFSHACQPDEPLLTNLYPRQAARNRFQKPGKGLFFLRGALTRS